MIRRRPPAARARRDRGREYKRKLSNYLLDKKLQLRYVLLVTILSGVIAGALGYLIYQQKRAASESIEKDLAGADPGGLDRRRTSRSTSRAASSPRIARSSTRWSASASASW